MKKEIERMKEKVSESKERMKEEVSERKTFIKCSREK